MADKCFCHLNGYEVKDAKARTDIVSIGARVTALENKGGGGTQWYKHVLRVTATFDSYSMQSGGVSTNVNIVVYNTSSTLITKYTLDNSFYIVPMQKIYIYYDNLQMGENFYIDGVNSEFISTHNEGEAYQFQAIPISDFISDTVTAL